MSYAVSGAVAAASVLISLASLCRPETTQAPSDDQVLVQKLIRQLRSGEYAAGSGTRSVAAYDLGKLGPRAEAAIPALLEVLDLKNDDELRKDAVSALGEIAPQDKRVIAALSRLLSELGQRTDLASDRVGGAVFEEATSALAKAGPVAIPVLIDRLVTREGPLGDEQGTFGAAARALGAIGPAALPALLEALADPSRRKGAVDALGYLGAQSAAESVPALLRHADDPNDSVRGSVYKALGNIGPAASDAVPALVAALDGPGDPRGDAVFALGRIGAAARGALPRLEQLAQETRNDQTGLNAKVRWAIDQLRSQSEAKPEPK